MGELTHLFAGLSRDVAIHLLGKPPYTTTSELRWGSKLGLVMNIAGARQGRFYDFSTGESGDLIDLVMREQGCSRISAIHWLQQFGGANLGVEADERVSHGSDANPKLRWSSRAQYIWGHASVPLAGTLGEVYLRDRCCYVPEVCDLRFLHGSGKYLPSLVGRVTDFRTGAPLSLCFIRLDPATATKVEKGNLGNHAIAGGVVRLVPCIEVGGALGLAEGIETALSVIAEGRGPVWATLGTGNLQTLPPLSRYPEVHVWADNNSPGIKAATAFADQWSAAGLAVWIIAPPEPGTDWNDFVLARHRATKGDH